MLPQSSRIWQVSGWHDLKQRKTGSPVAGQLPAIKDCKITYKHFRYTEIRGRANVALTQRSHQKRLLYYTTT